jgi:hypothetical protein
MTPAELRSPGAGVAVRLVHRVVCGGCGWIGYRLQPWGRDCPACGIDASKLRPVWLAGCAPRRGRCCYLGHIWPAYGHAEHYLRKPASSRLLKALCRPVGGEFAELTRVGTPMRLAVLSRLSVV